MRPSAWWVGIVVFGGSVALTMHSRQPAVLSDRSVPVSSPSVAVTPTQPPSPQLQSAAVTPYPATPRSLEDTEVDGSFTVTQKGQLLVTRSLRRIFDYFLSAEGEDDFYIIDERVRSHIARSLPNSAQTAALGIWSRYVAYRTAVGEFSRSISPLNDLDHLVHEWSALKVQFFTADERLAFFGDDDRARERFIQGIRQVLNPEESRELSSDIADPPELRSRDPIQIYLDRKAEIDDGRSSETPDELRRRLFDPAVVRRLEKFDRTRREESHR